MMFAKVTLPLLAVAGYYCTWMLSERTGFFAFARAIRDSKIPLLPGTDSAVRRVYTGVAPAVDEFLATLAVVFWPAIDGSTPPLSLQAFEFAGQYLALWMMFEMEVRRAGNKWTIISLYVSPF